MNISYQWLQEFVECPRVSITKLADMLTMAGLEVEGIHERRFCVPETVVVGEIRDAQEHTDSSNMYVCQVDVGHHELLTILCGAPNTCRGIKVPAALPNTVLPNGMTVTAAKIRGVVSQGMLCAEDELGISDDHSGIIVLPDDAPIGQPLTQEMVSVEDDTTLEIGLTPNRGDCLSHLGVAREVATLLKLPLRKPSVDYPENGADISQITSVSIEDPDLCYRYTASVITDVKIGLSPMWLRRRLESVGIRSINNVVDVTNLVMMELGQPLHAFDFAKLEDRKIIVRRAQPDEMFTTLDEVGRQLDENVLMIADGKRNVAIGGVMGGRNSEVSNTTTEIFLESAYFSPSSIRRTSKKLGLSTEASFRFERSIDLLGVDFALKRATKLIVELAGGKVARGLIDEFPHTYTPTEIVLRPQRVRKILGTSLTADEMQEILSRLGFQSHSEETQVASQQLMEVTVPSYRPDVTREIDLVEEVGRIYGYDNIPTMLPSGEIPPKMPNKPREVEKRVRELLVSQGMREAINYSFFDKESLEYLCIADKEPYNKVVPLKNPLNVDQTVLRTTTIPGLLRSVILNKSNRAKDIRLFEIGKVFVRTDSSVPLPDEKTQISGVITGSRTEMGWTHRQEPVDFYDVKGIIENIFQTLGIVYEFRQTTDIPFLHPGEAATIHAGDGAIGFVGKLHPDVVDAFDIDEDRIYLFELSLEQIVAQSSLERTFRSLPKFPAVHRDLALVVPASVQVSDVEAIIAKAGKPLLENVVLFDRYVGPQISEGCIGLTYSLTYRSLEKTLTDDEVSDIHQSIVEHLNTRLGVVLR
jgi:phenylalanyl-tRNA synthetase beta chain